MRIITHEDIVNLNISPLVCYELVDRILRLKNKAQLPPKISLKPFNGAFCNVMPCIIPDKEQRLIGGVKIVNRFPQNTPSLDSKLALIDMKQGSFVAVMDANWITAMRTGAVAVHSIDLFAKDNFSTISIIGLGNTARATLLVLLSMHPERKFKIKLMKYKNQEVSFMHRFKDYKNVDFECVNDKKEFIVGSDVIISCVTYAENDLFEDEWFDEGVLVVPVHTRGFANCDLFFDKVFADDYGHVCNFKYFDKFKSFNEVSDVLSGECAGRVDSKERIIAYNIGLAIHDVNFAKYIYNLIENNFLDDIDFKEPKNKFWV